MIKNALILLIILVPISLFSQNNLIANQLMLENHVLVTGKYLEFFPAFNNEFSVSYGLTNYFVAGVFYDFYYVSRVYENQSVRSWNHIPGLKLSCSLLPLTGDLKNKLPKLGISINGYLSYTQNPKNYYFGEKKDYQKFINYYRLNIRYHIGPKFYLSGSVGVLNSQRVLIGAGIKL